MSDASQKFYPYPHVVKYGGNVIGVSKAGISIKFLTVKRYVRPLEYQAPTKVSHVAKLPEVTSALIYFSGDTAAAAYGALATGTGANNAFAKGKDETSGAKALVIEPEGSRGIILTITKALCESNSIEGLTKNPGWNVIKWITLNNGEYNTADWTLATIGDSGEVTTRAAELAKVKQYFIDNYSQSTYIVQKPPYDWLPGLRSPSYFLSIAGIGHPYDDPDIIFVDVDIYIFNVNYTDPFGDTAIQDNNAYLSAVLQELSWDALQAITTLNMTGRIISSKKPFYDSRKQMCYSSARLRLYVNEG